MALSDEIALILKGQNVASPAIDEVVGSLKAMRTATVAAGKAFSAYNDLLTKTIGVNRDVALSFDGVTASIRSQIVALGDLALVQRTVQSSGFANTVAGAPVGSRAARSVANTVERDTGLAVRTGGVGLTQSGGFALGGVSGGAGLLGAATVPAVIAAVVGYLGFKTVNVANEFNQSVRDVIAASSQNLSQVPVIQQGILNLAGGQNRFTPQQIQAAQYAVQSTPAFAANPATALNALKVISQQGQPYGAAALPALAQADTGAFNAFHLSTQGQFAQVADIIAKGINVGAAEAPDFAKGIGTFAASGYAAGLTGTSGLAQLAGAFAQGSILSPRFRFDAQGLNALLQQVNGKQTAGAASVEANLGISNLFGVGSIGKAGGLPQWLTALQNATGALGPDQQQQFLQSIFTRQNSLQAVRGLTGQNFSSGQQRIADTVNYAGTVAAGARIADTGPQAQFDQMRSQFNKDVIEIGDTIAKTLNPDLLLLGTAAFNAAGKLGDFLGVVGTGIDKLSTLLNLPQKAGDIGSFIDQHVPGGKGTALVSALPGGLATVVAKGVWDRLGQLGFGSGSGPQEPDPTRTPRMAGMPHAGQFYNRRTGQWVTSAQAATQLPTAQTAYAQGSTGFTSAPNLFALGANVRSGAAGLSPGDAISQARISNRTPGVESILPLRAMTSGVTEAAGATSGLGAMAGQAGTAVGSLVQHLITFADGVGRVSRAVSAANALNAKGGITPGQQLTLDRGSLQYQLNVGASNKVLDAAVAQVKADLVTSGKSAVEQRNLLEQYTKSVTAIENGRIVDRANKQYGGLQDQVTLDTLKHLPTAQDIKTLSAFITSNRKALGLDPVQAQIAVLQLQQSQQQAIVKQAQVQLIRPTTAGAGNLVQANYGASVASLASGSGASSAFAELQKENAALRQQVAYLQKLVGINQSSDTSLKSIAATNALIARAAKSPPTLTSPLHGLQHIPRHGA